MATNGGVKGLRIAEFDHVANIASTEQLSQLVSASLSDEWQRFITDREGSDKLSVRSSFSPMAMGCGCLLPIWITASWTWCAWS